MSALSGVGWLAAGHWDGARRVSRKRPGTGPKQGARPSARLAQRQGFLTLSRLGQTPAQYAEHLARSWAALRAGARPLPPGRLGGA